MWRPSGEIATGASVGAESAGSGTNERRADDVVPPPDEGIDVRRQAPTITAARTPAAPAIHIHGILRDAFGAPSGAAFASSISSRASAM